MVKSRETYCIDDVSSVVKSVIIPHIEDYKIFTFSGPLGAGKTTLVKEILRQCGVVEAVTSPTFSYVNSYTNDEGVSFYHFDLYRIDSLDAFFDAGFNEYFHKKKAVCLVEWPKVVSDFLNSFNVLHVDINYNRKNLGERELVVSFYK